MNNTKQEILDWLKGYKYGVSLSDKLILLLYLINGIFVLTTLYGLFGRDKAGRLALSHPNLLNWVPANKVLVNIDGCLLYLPVVIDYVILVKLDWEREEKEFVDSLMPDGNAILDVGANIGYYTTHLAKKFQDSQVIAVEASPSIFKMLKSNCSLNNLSNVAFLNNAVTQDDERIIDFYKRGQMSTTNKQILEDWQVPQSEIETEKTKTITIDAIISKQKISKVLLLKMDIEGSEVDALDGAKSALSKKIIQNMVIEYHSHSSQDKIKRLLEGLGYSVSIQPRQILYENKDHANGHIFAKL